MIKFVKYHGAGNDFIMVDQRKGSDEAWDTEYVAHLCNRRFGIGADGLIILRNHPTEGIEMVYFNSNGSESTLCGNGGRCFVAFAKHLGIAHKHLRFMAIDGPHQATIEAHPNGRPGWEWVELEMNPVTQIERLEEQVFVLNTGSPHYIHFTPDVAAVNIVEEGRRVRYSEPFKPKGINANWVQVNENPFSLSIRTYERGVEDETLACGTGVTAAALSYAKLHALQGNLNISVHAVGGDLAVRCQAGEAGFSDIWLCGPATRVFEGSAS